MQQYRRGTTVWLKAHCLVVTCWQRRSNATVTTDSINLESEFTGNSRARREEQFVKYTLRRIPNGNARLQTYLFTGRWSRAVWDLFNPMRLSFERVRVSTQSQSRVGVTFERAINAKPVHLRMCVHKHSWIQKKQ